MAELEQLKQEIEALGEKIKELKSSGAEKDSIGSAVSQLLEKKKAYADANNGIGVDGKPYEPPLTSAQKKAKAKAEKVAAVEVEKSGDASTKVSLWHSSLVLVYATALSNKQER